LQTFCVITKKYGKHYVYRFSSTKSMYILGPLNPLRKFGIYLVTHRWFDVVIILTILANCVTLALGHNPPDKELKTRKYDKYADTIE